MEVYADSKQKPGRAVQGTSGSGLPAISGIPTRTEYYPACVHSTLQPSLPAALLSCDSCSTRKIGQYVCRHRISKTPEGVDYQISDFRRSSCCLVSGGRSSNSAHTALGPDWKGLWCEHLAFREACWA